MKKLSIHLVEIPVSSARFGSGSALASVVRHEARSTDTPSSSVEADPRTKSHSTMLLQADPHDSSHDESIPERRLGITLSILRSDAVWGNAYKTHEQQFRLTGWTLSVLDIVVDYWRDPEYFQECGFPKFAYGDVVFATVRTFVILKRLNNCPLCFGLYGILKTNHINRDGFRYSCFNSIRCTRCMNPNADHSASNCKDTRNVSKLPGSNRCYACKLPSPSSDNPSFCVHNLDPRFGTRGSYKNCNIPGDEMCALARFFVDNPPPGLDDFMKFVKDQWKKSPWSDSMYLFMLSEGPFPGMHLVYVVLGMCLFYQKVQAADPSRTSKRNAESLSPLKRPTKKSANP